MPQTSKSTVVKLDGTGPRHTHRRAKDYTKVMYQNDWAPEQWSSPNQQSRYPRREDHRTARLHLRA